MKTTRNYLLNKGEGMARGLYNISSKDGKLVSLWFNESEARELRRLKAKQFDRKCDFILTLNK